MRIDMTLPITQEMLKDAMLTPNAALVGHAGTHFDVMDKAFPLTYTELKGIVLDVSQVSGRDIDVSDIDPELVEPDMFVALYTGYAEKEPYGTRAYFSEHPQLSNKLIDMLLDKGVSIIGIDFAGVRRGKEHTPADQRCADKGVFVIENLYDLRKVLQQGGRFTAHTYPMRCSGMTGLPCRVIAEV